jgi:hypothetical protein
MSTLGRSSGHLPHIDEVMFTVPVKGGGVHPCSTVATLRTHKVSEECDVARLGIPLVNPRRGTSRTISQMASRRRRTVVPLTFQEAPTRCVAGTSGTVRTTLSVSAPTTHAATGNALPCPATLSDRTEAAAYRSARVFQSTSRCPAVSDWLKLRQTADKSYFISRQPLYWSIAQGLDC